MTYSPLDLVEGYLRRFVLYPSEHARTAHVLWIAHTHLMDCFDTTPRLALMSAEKESGKTRALEITELFVPDPIFSFSATPAVIMRLVASSRRTVLYDEVDGVFGTAKAQESNAELCGFLNSGYRRGAKAYRCTTNGKKIEPEEFDAFAAVAVAGLRDLPDTLASRAIFIRMKRRAPDEQVEPFRHRYHRPEAKPIADELAEWCAAHEANLCGAEPALPDGIKDRSADCWEPLIAIADEAGDDWPKRARAAAVALAIRASDEAVTAGVELLRHVREAFGDADRLWTEALLDRLCSRPESPWREINFGKPLNDRGLAKRLKPYGIKSKDVKLNGVNRKGFAADDFADAWSRYLPPCSGSATSATSATNLDNQTNLVAEVAEVALRAEEGANDGDPFAGMRDPKFGLQSKGDDDDD
jgi:hypothetical protein